MPKLYTLAELPIGSRVAYHRVEATSDWSRNREGLAATIVSRTEHIDSTNSSSFLEWEDGRRESINWGFSAYGRQAHWELITAAPKKEKLGVETRVPKRKLARRKYDQPQLRQPVLDDEDEDEELDAAALEGRKHERHSPISPTPQAAQCDDRIKELVFNALHSGFLTNRQLDELRRLGFIEEPRTLAEALAGDDTELMSPEDEADLIISQRRRATNDFGDDEELGEPEARRWWTNYYTCPRCGADWDDFYDSQPDDDCPNCGCRHVSPHESVECYEDGDPLADERTNEEL